MSSLRCDEGGREKRAEGGGGIEERMAQVERNSESFTLPSRVNCRLKRAAVAAKGALLLPLGTMSTGLSFPVDAHCSRLA